MSKVKKEESPFQKGLAELIKKSGGIGEIDSEELIKDLVSGTYQMLLDAEMENHLGYEKHERTESSNARNGYGKKQIKGDFGQAEIAVPRDRESSFQPIIVPKRSSQVAHFGDKIISLYARGLSTREIAEHLEELYGIEASPMFISKTTDAVKEQVIAWQSRPLEKVYPVIFFDGIRYSVRQDSQVIKKCVYIALGISLGGKQDVLGMWMAENEGASFWLNICNELKNRGVEDVLIACVDGLKGLPEAIESVFPKVNVQLCVVHFIRYATKFLAYKDRKAFCKDLKKVYGATTLEAAEQALLELEENWGQKYPASIKTWTDNWTQLSTFFQYPVELRKVIYTTNAIESLNSVLRNNTRNKKVFPTDESLMKILFLNVEKISKKWRFRKDWNSVINQLSMIFSDRFKLEDIA